MKKFTLFLALMVTMVTSAFAQGSEVIDIASNADAMLYSNAPCKVTTWGDDFKGWHVLFDNDPSTFFHSDYSGDPSVDGLDHYWRVDMGEGNSVSLFTFTFTTRSSNCDVNSPTTIVVEGSNEADGEYTEIATLSGLPTTNSTVYTSETLGSEDVDYRYIRYRVTATKSMQKQGGKVFFFIAEFGMSKVKAGAVLANIQYTYTYNGETIGSATSTAFVGDAYPEPTNVPFGYYAATPEGVVEGDVEKVIECTENLPFKYAATVDAIETWYYMQMHSNTKKYIQYVEGASSLEWADAEVAEGEEDSYTWAFVGSAADGFKLVNYAAGNELAVCSNGSNDPALGAFADAVAWIPAASDIAGNGYFCLQFPGSSNYMNAQNGKVAYWNDNDAGSTILLTEREFTVVEPELPALEITGYTPTEAVESLKEITVTFSDEIEGVQNVMSMTQIYVGDDQKMANFSVEGNVLTITMWSAITTPGEYGLYIPAGVGITRKATGEAVTMNGEIKFTVVEPVKPLEVVSYTPTEAVESLKDITVTFSDEIEGVQNVMSMTQIYVGDDQKMANFSVEGNVLTITMWSAITTPGEYGLYIPAGVGITRKATGEAVTMNGEIVFTVKEAAPVEPEQPEVTYYRIKTTTATGDAIYLNIGNTVEHQTGPRGGANVVAFAEDDNQIFAIEEATEGWCYLKSKSGYYIKGWEWNVDGSADKKTEIKFVDAEDGYFYILNKNEKKGKELYFKVEWVGDAYYPFCDVESVGGAAKWTLEEVAAVEPEQPEQPTVDEATVALVATAKELIALEGIGYPAAAPRAELQAVIDAAEAAPTTENGTALQAAINAYYAATDVVLPENGKAYTFKAVYGNNKFYIYNNNGTLAVAACGDEELPESAKFICEYDSEDDYMFQFKTADGAYYLAYPSIGGKSWLDGESATGLEAESTQVTKFNINKILGGNNVAAQNSELLGLVELDGWRGYHNEQYKDEFGPIVVKHSALTFDGASAPFYNANFTSAFCVEETEIVVEPLTVIAVTPAEAVESLQTITIEFDAEIAVDEANVSACTIDYGWTVIIGTTAPVEGNVLKLVSDTPIQNKGQYPLTIPAGVVTRASDGVAYEGGVFTFEVKEKEKEPLAVVKVTPEAEVEKLDVITIEFNYNMSVNAMSAVVATIANADNSISYTFNTMDDIKYDGKVITFNLGENAITASGEYTLTIPSGLISATDGTKYSGTHTFTVVAPAAPETFAVEAFLFPAPQGEVTKINGIRVEANQGQLLSALPTGWTFTNEAGKEFDMKIEWLYNYETILIMFNPAIEEAGTYTLNIPAGSLKTDDGKECEAATFEFTIGLPIGIDGIEAEGEQTIYDLTGRKIETITKGGIYIVNGKKVLVK